MKYTGVIDNLGLESFTELEGNKFPYRMRAFLNLESRNAEAYVVDLTKKEADKILELIKTKEWVKIGKIVKGFKSYKSIM